MGKWLDGTRNERLLMEEKVAGVQLGEAKLQNLSIILAF